MISAEKMAELRKKIDQEKAKLHSQVDMEESEKSRIEIQLAKKEADLTRAQQEQDALQVQLLLRVSCVQKEPYFEYFLEFWQYEIFRKI